MKANKTQRGFSFGNFNDGNGQSCSIQESSAYREGGMLWLGCNEIRLNGFFPYRGGWIEYSDDQLKEILTKHQNCGVDCDTVLANTRMHLTRENVEELVSVMSHWLKTGDLPEE